MFADRLLVTIVRNDSFMHAVFVQEGSGGGRWSLRYAVLCSGRLLFFTGADCAARKGAFLLPADSEAKLMENRDGISKPDASYAFGVEVLARERVLRIALATGTTQRYAHMLTQIAWIITIFLKRCAQIIFFIYIQVIALLFKP